MLFYAINLRTRKIEKREGNGIEESRINNTNLLPNVFRDFIMLLFCCFCFAFSATKRSVWGLFHANSRLVGLIYAVTFLYYFFKK
jgi:hypothetical protein